MTTADGITMTAAILGDLLTRGTTGRGPDQPSDDMDWIATSGRAESPDNGLPLID